MRFYTNVFCVFVCLRSFKFLSVGIGCVGM